LPNFADYPQGKFTPAIHDDIASGALRGVDASDLPDSGLLRSISQPTLIPA